MPEKFEFDAEKYEAGREKMDKMVAQLAEKHGATITPDRMNVGAYVYKIQFPFESGETVTTIFISCKDWQTGADVVITNMTTLPDEKKNRGFGSQALDYILEWAEENNLDGIRATQVGRDDAERFWRKNGFEEVEGDNPTRDFVYKKPEDSKD